MYSNRLHEVLVLLALSYASVLAIPVGNDGRIVNGNTAEPGQFPYQVSLRAGNNSHFCGAVIIRPNWLVTAAHCVYIGQQGVKAWVGAHNMVDNGTSHDVIQIINHPEYEIYEGSDFYEFHISNDISLLRLGNPIEYSETVQPIGIGTEERIGAGVQAIASGWGNSNPDWQVVVLPEYLQWMEQFTLSNLDCQSRHATYSHVVNDKNICAFSRRGQGLCHGDSGGPLVANGQLIGLASWVEPCAQGRPDVYSRVSSHFQWILETLGDDQ